MVSCLTRTFVCYGGQKDKLCPTGNIAISSCASNTNDVDVADGKC